MEEVSEELVKKPQKNSTTHFDSHDKKSSSSSEEVVPVKIPPKKIQNVLPSENSKRAKEKVSTSSSSEEVPAVKIPPKKVSKIIEKENSPPPQKPKNSQKIEKKKPVLQEIVPPQPPAPIPAESPKKKIVKKRRKNPTLKANTIFYRILPMMKPQKRTTKPNPNPPEIRNRNPAAHRKNILPIHFSHRSDRIILNPIRR